MDMRHYKQKFNRQKKRQHQRKKTVEGEGFFDTATSLAKSFGTNVLKPTATYLGENKDLWAKPLLSGVSHAISAKLKAKAREMERKSKEKNKHKEIEQFLDDSDDDDKLTPEEERNLLNALIENRRPKQGSGVPSNVMKGLSMTTTGYGIKYLTLK
jgi:hypothetical protein